MKQGDRSTFARSVNIEIGEYVKVRSKILLTDSLVSALNVLKVNEGAAIKSFINKLGTLQADADAKGATIERKDQAIRDLNKQFDAYDKAWKKWRASKSPLWDTVIKITVAGGVGYIAGKTLHR